MTTGRERAVGLIAGAPMVWHALALLVALLALAPVVGTGVSYSADEGAAIIQAQSVADGDGWIIEHPIPEVDPEGDHYPLELSPEGPKGVAAYAKHPAYPWALAGADRLGGQSAMVLLSVVGTWAAAVGSAFLAGSLVGGYRRTSLWVLGAGSPLLFDGYWVIAHSMAAALVVWALCAALRLDRGGWRWLVLLAVPVLTGVAALLRTEVALYAAGLGLALVAIGALERHWLVLAAGASMGIAALAARALDARLVERIVGTPVGSTGAFQARPRGGGAAGRWDGFVATWLRPGPPGDRGIAVVVVVAAAILIVAVAVVLRRARWDVAVGASVAAALLLVVRAVVLPAEAIPALLVAFPLLGFAVVAAIGEPWAFGRRAALVGAGLAISWAGVLATQYAEGGVAEWGGRYFAVGLPVAVPLVVALAGRLVDHAPGREARTLRVAMGLSLAALSIAAVRELRDVHDSTARTLERIDRLAVEAGPEPVIVTDAPAIPRLDWASFDEHRWLLVDPASDPTLPDRLAGSGVERWVLVSADVDRALEAFTPLRVVDEASPSIVLVEPAR